MLNFLSVGMQASVVCYWSEIIHWVQLSSIHNDHIDVTHGTEGGFKTLKKKEKRFRLNQCNHQNIWTIFA